MPLTQINLKWIKKLIIRSDSIKFLEENVGRKLIDISCGIDFFEHDAKSTNNKSKKSTNRATSNSKVSVQQKKQQNENTTYRMGENFYKLSKMYFKN